MKDSRSVCSGLAPEYSVARIIIRGSGSGNIIMVDSRNLEQG